jgi:hypothetical protein
MPQRLPFALVPLLLVAFAAGCASARMASLRPAALSVDDASNVARPEISGACASCVPPSMDSQLAAAIEKRVADLKALGGECAVYGSVLESSYRSGQITLRPYMWRVAGQLASGEGRPDGTMVLAREIDSLNVGVRTIDDVVWTLEHEAAHIAFNISNGADAADDRANARVRACRPMRH